MSVNLANPNNEVLVREEYGEQRTGGHFASKSFKFSIAAAQGWSDNDFSFPIPISIFAAQVVGQNDWEGDEIEFQIAPGAIIGVVNVDVSVGDDEITVDDTSYAALKVGFYLVLDDSTNSNDLGAVLEKKANNVVKVETVAVNAFVASTPTYCKMTVKMIPHGYLPYCSRLVIGDSKIGGTYIAAGTTMRIRYKNSDGLAKFFAFWLEYMY